MVYASILKLLSSTLNITEWWSKQIRVVKTSVLLDSVTAGQLTFKPHPLLRRRRQELGVKADADSSAPSSLSVASEEEWRFAEGSVLCRNRRNVWLNAPRTNLHAAGKLWALPLLLPWAAEFSCSLFSRSMSGITASATQPRESS